MSPSAQNEHPIITGAREAITSFQPDPYYGTALRDLRFHQEAIPSVFGKVEANAKAILKEEASIIRILQVDKKRMIRKNKGNIAAINIAIEKHKAIKATYDRALAMIHAAQKSSYRKSAFDFLARFEKNKDGSSPESIKYAAKKIRILFEHAGMETWTRKERREISARIKQAIRASHIADERRMKTAMKEMNGACYTVEDIERIGERIAAHAKKTGTWNKARKIEIEKDMIEASARILKDRVEAYATAPRFYSATAAERKAEERNIHDLHFYARYANGMESCRDLVGTLAMARAESEALAKQHQEEEKARVSEKPPSNSKKVIPFPKPRLPEQPTQMAVGQEFLIQQQG